MRRPVWKWRSWRERLFTLPWRPFKARIWIDLDEQQAGALSEAKEGE